MLVARNWKREEVLVVRDSLLGSGGGRGCWLLGTERGRGVYCYIIFSPEVQVIPQESKQLC